jgi:hypothetical protein
MVPRGIPSLQASATIRTITLIASTTNPRPNMGVVRLAPYPTGQSPESNTPRGLRHTETTRPLFNEQARRSRVSSELQIHQLWQTPSPIKPGGGPMHVTPGVG